MANALDRRYRIVQIREDTFTVEERNRTLFWSTWVPVELDGKAEWASLEEAKRIVAECHDLDRYNAFKAKVVWP